MEEKWRSVVGYEDSYEVSSLGRVRSLDRIDARGHHRLGRLMTPTLTGKKNCEHYRVTFHLNSKRETIYLHRVVAEAFIPNPEGLPFVLHWDDNPANNRVENLHWGTHADNMREMSERGRHVSVNATKTECRYGHPFDEENTKRRKDGSRDCRTCVNIKQRARYWEKKLRRVA